MLLKYRLMVLVWLICGMLMASSCSPGPSLGNDTKEAKSPHGEHGSQPIAMSGQEVWVIDGQQWRIYSTYYLSVSGGLQYTINYPYSFTKNDDAVSQEKFTEKVFPLIRHAYVNKLYNRIAVLKLGQGRQDVVSIGVLLLDMKDSRSRGYPVSMSMQEIERRSVQK